MKTTALSLRARALVTTVPVVVLPRTVPPWFCVTKAPPVVFLSLLALVETAIEKSPIKENYIFHLSHI
jgi:hypothetical protein